MNVCCHNTDKLPIIYELHRLLNLSLIPRALDPALASDPALSLAKLLSSALVLQVTTLGSGTELAGHWLGAV